MCGPREEEDVSLGPKEDDQCPRSRFDHIGGILGGVGVCGRLRSLSEEGFRVFMAGVLGCSAQARSCIARGLFERKPSEQSLDDLLFLDFKVEDLANYTAPRPDDVVPGGDQLIGGTVVVLVGVGVPDIVALGAVFVEDGLGDQVLQGSGLMDPDGAKRGHSEARLAA
jgi:hypothetical protein